METQRSAQFEEYLVAKAIQHDSIEDSMHLPAASINNGISSSPSTPLSKVVTSTDDSVIFTNPSSIESQNTTTTQIISNHQQQSSDTAGVLETNDNDNDNNSSTAQEEIHVVNSVNNGSSENLNIRSVAQDIEETGVAKPETYETDDDEANVTTNLLVNHKSASTPAVNNTFDFEKNTLMTHQNGSYIHDQDSETILLNTARLRGSSRTTGTENFSQANLRNRNSTFTTGSKNVDTATIEIERVRNSIISKREQKKKQRSHLDDDKVLVGNKVGEGHVNYVVAYNMLTGIRVAVSRCSGIMKPLTDQDFRLSKKLVFDVSGNELTPSSKYDFKFKDYCPTVFRELRQLFGLDPADYLVSLTSKYILSELNSPGKSGSFFYFSRDYRFIIKTIHPAEHRQLRRILKEYYIHIKDNPNTLLSQFYGLHRVKMPLSYGMKRRRIYFIVMNNLFPPHKDIQKTFDLKGSTMGRYTNPKLAKTNVVYKDLNWIENKEIIYFGPEKYQIFVDQLKKDVKLLIKLRIMDYSFLIGVHDLKKAHDEDDVIKNKKLSVFSPISSNINDLRNTNPKLLDKLNELPGYDHPRGNVFYSNDGGVIATNIDNEDIEYIYYLGIIDCLTHYSIVKRLETFWRSLNHDRKTISAVPPKEYGERFKSFILHSLNENTLMKAKKQ